MSLNKETEAFGNFNQGFGNVNRSSSPPRYSIPPSNGPIQPTFTGQQHQQFQTTPLSPGTPMSQLPAMQTTLSNVNRGSSPQYNIPPNGPIQPNLTGQQQQFQTAPLSPGTFTSQLPAMQTTYPVNQFGVVQPGGAIRSSTLPPAYNMNTQPAYGLPNTMNTLPAGGFQNSMNAVPMLQPTMQYPIMMQPPVVVQQQQQPNRAVSTAFEIGEQFRAEQFALCAMGNHEIRKKYGPLGIICAILFFPIGLICMFADVEESCIRCGKRL